MYFPGDRHSSSINGQSTASNVQIFSIRGPASFYGPRRESIYIADPFKVGATWIRENFNIRSLTVLSVMERQPASPYGEKSFPNNNVTVHVGPANVKWFSSFMVNSALDWVVS